MGGLFTLCEWIAIGTLRAVTTCLQRPDLKRFPRLRHNRHAVVWFLLMRRNAILDRAIARLLARLKGSA